MSAARLLAATALVAVLFAGSAPSASAGSSHWVVEPDPVRVGDTVSVWAAVAWGHDSGLGTPDDGPYHAAIQPRGSSSAWSFDDMPASAVRVAEIEIVLEPYDTGDYVVGPYHARFEFTMPPGPTGTWDILHCNDPCTTLLGDIIFGEFEVVDGVADPAPGAPATTPTTAPIPTSTAAAPATTEAPSVTAPAVEVPLPAGIPEDAPDTDRVPLLAGSTLVGAAAALVGLATWVSRRRRR